jgi:hypothetical protein
MKRIDGLYDFVVRDKRVRNGVVIEDVYYRRYLYLGGAVKGK